MAILKVPALWLDAIVHQDYSGLSDDSKGEVNRWLAEHNLIFADIARVGLVYQGAFNGVECSVVLVTFKT